MMLLVTWLAGCGLWEAQTCGEESPGERALRRLTHEEYDRTVTDLLGVDLSLATGFAADPVVAGFRNDAGALVVEGLLADQYRTAAEALAEAANLTALLPCDPGAGEACALEFVSSFGQRAFRRPLSEDDLVRYGELWATVSAADGFETGVRWVITAMLQSPHFLYRSELGVHTRGRNFELTDWEMASALSYTFWGTMPDEELLRAAASGDLSSNSDIEAQVERLLADPRSGQLASGFLDAWLDLGQLETVPREGLTNEARNNVRNDAHAWVDGLAGSDGTLADLMADAALLTHPALLTRHARSDGSSPIHRGLMVRERLLCEELPPPPSNINISPPAIDLTLTTRDRFAQHTASEVCAECHVLMDPLGHGFENYDQLGQFRETDNGHPVNATGDVDGIPYEGVSELSDLLLADERFRTCFVYSWRRHARGTYACGDDLGSDVGLLDPLIAIPTTYGFQVRRGQASEGDTFAVDADAAETGVTIDGPDGIVLDVRINNDWGNGYCAEGAARNDSDEAVPWVVNYEKDGAITSIWSAQYEVAGEEWVFRGMNPDVPLEPGDIARFGFCVDR